MFINKDTINDVEIDESIILQVYDIKIIQSYLQSCVNLNLLEKVLINIGYSINASPLYKQYLSMLARLPDENTKIEKIRNTFIHILQIPMHNLPELYGDYEEFEMEVNKTQAKKILQETFLIYQNTLSFYHQIKKGNDMILEMENPLKLNEEGFYKRISFLYREQIYFNYKNEEVYFNFSEYLIKNNKLDEAQEIIKMGLQNTASITLKIYSYYRNLEVNNYQDLLINIDNNKDAVGIPQFSSILVMNYLSFILKKEGLITFRKEFIRLKIKKIINDVIYKNVLDYEYKYTGSKDIVIKIFICGIEDTGSVYLKQELVNFLLKIGDYNNALLYAKKYEVGFNQILDYEFKYGTGFFSLLNTNRQPFIVQDSKPNNIKSSQFEITQYLFSFGMNITLREDVLDFIRKINYIKKRDDLLHNVDLDKLIEMLRIIN